MAVTVNAMIAGAAASPKPVKVMAAHQPHFLPWLGYFDKIRRADLFVLVDHVQFERQNFQNRNRIASPSGPHWLVVPVRQLSREERICDKEINQALDSHRTWSEKICRALACAYGKAPYYRRYRADIEGLLRSPWRRLVDLDEALIRHFMQVLGIRTPILRSSSLGIEGAKSEMVVNLCKAVSASTYLSGSGGSRRYLQSSLFAEDGLDVSWQEFQHPVYFQCQGAAGFVPRLSVVDLVFNCGPESPSILWGTRHQVFSSLPRDTEGSAHQRKVG